MGDGEIEARRVERQTRRGGASQGPTDEHDAGVVVCEVPGEVEPSQQIRAPAVIGMGVPIRGHHRGAVACEQTGKGPDGSTSIGLHPVPQQNRGLHGIAEDIGQTSRGVLHRPHSHECAHATRIQSRIGKEA